ncbi:hypothetical protein EVAR_23666_1 [Eumeta japonica]|uniref:Uncharacterized protein n=1 Tax=Eumeta variegata TaxID=151549 RepID=A0A4C1VIQ2_EUMVA|nr:hypothetical protein EVAR_23666_1 [Eumeta japonica]
MAIIAAEDLVKTILRPFIYSKLVQFISAKERRGRRYCYWYRVGGRSDPRNRSIESFHEELRNNDNSRSHSAVGYKRRRTACRTNGIGSTAGKLDTVVCPITHGARRKSASSRSPAVDSLRRQTFKRN